MVPLECVPRAVGSSSEIERVVGPRDINRFQRCCTTSRDIRTRAPMNCDRFPISPSDDEPQLRGPFRQDLGLGRPRPGGLSPAAWAAGWRVRDIVTCGRPGWRVRACTVGTCRPGRSCAASNGLIAASWRRWNGNTVASQHPCRYPATNLLMLGILRLHTPSTGLGAWLSVGLSPDRQYESSF